MLSNKHFVYIYVVTVLCFVFYFGKTVIPCSAYYIHDDAIMVSAEKVIKTTALLFLPAAFIALIASVKKCALNSKLIYVQYFSSLLSITLFAIAIHKPCMLVGDYMFVDFLLIAPSFIFGLLAHLLTLILLVALIKKLIKP